MKGLAKKEVISELREKLLVWEGFRRNTQETDQPDFGLAAMASAFPCGVLPTGAVHEFISPTAACATATNGFVSGLLSTLMKDNAPCLWVSTKRSIFPVGLAHFGIEPHRIIFVDVKKDKDALWVMEQGLKCNALAAVVAELGEVTFAQSQRLQLAVEASRVTGFLHRKRPHREHTLACVSRWKIRPAASIIAENLPGLGFSAWEVDLERIRNGKPGKWLFGWEEGRFIPIPSKQHTDTPVRKIEHYA